MFILISILIVLKAAVRAINNIFPVISPNQDDVVQASIEDVYLGGGFGYPPKSYYACDELRQPTSSGEEIEDSYYHPCSALCCCDSGDENNDAYNVVDRFLTPTRSSQELEDDYLEFIDEVDNIQFMNDGLDWIQEDNWMYDTDVDEGYSSS